MAPAMANMKEEASKYHQLEQSGDGGCRKSIKIKRRLAENEESEDGAGENETSSYGGRKSRKYRRNQRYGRRWAKMKGEKWRNLSKISQA
jgi:hypothetical protein